MEQKLRHGRVDPRQISVHRTREAQNRLLLRRSSIKLPNRRVFSPALSLFLLFIDEPRPPQPKRRGEAQNGVVLCVSRRKRETLETAGDDSWRVRRGASLRESDRRDGEDDKATAAGGSRRERRSVLDVAGEREVVAQVEAKRSWVHGDGRWVSGGVESGVREDLTVVVTVGAEYDKVAEREKLRAETRGDGGE